MASEEDLTERIKAVAAVIRSPVFKGPLQQWHQERISNRRLLQGMWSDIKDAFNQYCDRKDNVEQKSAMVITALEDLPDSLAGGFIPLVCTELVHIQEEVCNGLLTDDKVFREVFDIVQYVVDERENDKSIFDQSFLEKSLEFEENERNVENGTLVMHSLLLVRSCVLLQFCIAICLVFGSLDE